MPRITMTRRVTFAAAHRYRRPDWSEERNAEVFGICSRPSYHGHSYVCEVTVSSSLDEETGMIVDLGVLDRILAREVREKFDHTNINTDIPEFADGRLIPTGENIARFICTNVQRDLGDMARVESVRIAEDETLSITYYS